MFVEGTGGQPPCADNCFWGENLQGVQTHPVQMTDNTKLVYSPHVYGPSVAYQPYFSAPNFPNNMPPIWATHFAYLETELQQNAFVIGEWGGQYTGQDQVWADALVDFLLGIDSTDSFYWCLNPDSGDTGGLLEYDWITPVTAKLELIATLIPNPTNVTQLQEGIFCVTNSVQ